MTHITIVGHSLHREGRLTQLPRLYILLMLMVCGVHLSRAQDSTNAALLCADAHSDFVRPTHSLGFSAGALAGLGHSYRHWFAGKQGIQVTGFPIAYDNASERYGFVSLGILGLRALYDTPKFSPLIYYGGHLLYNYTRFKPWVSPVDVRPSPSDVIQENPPDENLLVFLGGGLGSELRWNRWSLSPMVGYSVTSHFRPRNPNNSFDWVIHPSMELSLMFAL